MTVSWKTVYLNQKSTKRDLASATTVVETLKPLFNNRLHTSEREAGDRFSSSENRPRDGEIALSVNLSLVRMPGTHHRTGTTERLVQLS